jgi:hypothetical protein
MLAARLGLLTALFCGAAIAKESGPVTHSPEIQRLLTDLDSHDESVRANAARRLFELHDPHALEANLKTLDDAAEPLHGDYTPAVGALIALGKPALVPLCDRLDAPAEMTRRRAMNAVIGITQRLFGRDLMKGWSQGAENRWFVWWGAIGYRPDADEAVRKPAIARLRAWRAP